ncbi:MAG: ABC transporter permease subunit [Betaproteobacteria bacterium]|nr:ABC transporter permease subunit [Betaproteobacteria bacterium]
MIAYLVRRALYAIPILIGVNALTFALFFVVNTPDDMARMQLGVKRVTPEAIEQWKHEHGYDVPLLFNAQESGFGHFTSTVFFRHSLKLFTFDFGRAESDGRDIGSEIRRRMWPSLSIALPVFVIGLAAYVSFALILVFFRGTYVDDGGVILCVAAMSISAMFYIIAGQYVVGKLWHLTPISGFGDGLDAWRFIILPIAVALVSSFGEDTRLYRTFFLEETGKDYVRTARAKGLPEHRVMFGHVLRNALIPILTGAVVVVPRLFLGSLVLESFFGIPGLGSFTIDAIGAQDFAVVRTMVFLGSLLYIVGLTLTDLSYTVVDPRVRFS